MEMRTPATLAALALLVIGFTGCTADRFTYESPAHQPTTLTVVNALNESQELWKMDIPEGTKLVVEFETVENGYDDAVFGYVDPDVYPVRMDYSLYPLSAERVMGVGGYYFGKEIDEGTVAIPRGTPTKMVVSYRMRKAIYEEVDDPMTGASPLSQGNEVQTAPAPVAEMPSGDGVVLRAK